MIRLLSIVVVFVALSQCVKPEQQKNPPTWTVEINITDVDGKPIKIPTAAAEIELGRQTYVANCIRCHNANPRLPGVIGPDLYTTPLAVFKTKVPDGKYPEGYTPKRKSRVMPRFKHLTNKVDQIYLYIRSK